MSILRKIPMKIFYVVIAALAIGLAFWQYDLAMGDRKGAVEVSSSSDFEMEFKLSDGSTVRIPDDTTRLSVVVFWGVSSVRSISLADELMQIAQAHTYDSVFDFYAVNLADSPEIMRRAVDFDNSELPFGYDPSGSFLNSDPIRSLPLTVVFSGTGKLIAKIEGYEEGALVNQLEQYLTARRLLGPSGEFKFRVD